MGSLDAEPSSSRASGEWLVLVSDTSTEAERLIASLRVRGFKVRDVPLMLLPGRVEAQKPRLVICDGQVPHAAESVIKMRQGQWGKSVELFLLGLEPRTIDALRSVVADVENRVFARPIDVYSVLQRVEEVIGQVDPSVRPGMRSMTSLPRVGSGSPIPSRVPTPPPRRSRTSAPNASRRPDSMLGAGEPAEPSAPRQPSLIPPSEISVSDPAVQSVSVARMSEELEQLLHDADRRLANGTTSLQPIAASATRLSPEQELDAILPPDVLAALDDPVDLDEEDETSHPMARNRERTSARAPDHHTALASNPVFSRPSASTSALDEETPAGRLVGRARAGTSAGSENSSEFYASPVLTPVPPSIKTHHTHHTQTNATAQGASSPQAAPTGDLLDALSDRLPSSSRHDAAWRRRNEADSVAPGTSPELEPASARPNIARADIETGNDETGNLDERHRVRETTSTTPPHAARMSGPEPRQPAESFDDLAAALEREPYQSIEPPPTAAVRGSQQPIGSSSRALPTVSREPVQREHAGGRELPAPAGKSPRETPAAERDTSPPRSAHDATDGQRQGIEIPPALGPGDVVRALSRCVRCRYSGALALEDDSGIRRIVMREGDFVMVASGIEGESLIAFLIQRGDLDADAARLARKLPQFGRHAGAALIAHGYLRQDELWPVLRAHAEWLLGRALLLQQGAAGLETDLPPRLSAEPAVFAGATGAEILIEVVRRVISPEVAIAALGGLRVRITRGGTSRLLSECALPITASQLVERASGLPLEEMLGQVSSPDFASALYALVELGVLETMAPSSTSTHDEQQSLARDGLDDAAVRSRVAIRRSLVDEGDYFAFLGVRREATGYEVRHAYLELRREFDPSRLLTASTADLRDDVDLILEVLDEAYEILRDASRRERYRRALEAPPKVG
ncbi:MAG: hypothetical protein ACM3ZE_19590 [Myxococcales bacterium]